MSLLDSGLVEAGFTPEVLGTDVSTQALDRAREAIYRDKALANLPAAGRAASGSSPFQAGTGRSAAFANVVDFSYHNLIKEPYPLMLMGNWDVIFCRNVTIYFKFESTRRVVNNFYESLNPGGYLFVGHSETLTSISDRFEVVEIDGVFLYRKPRRPASGVVRRGPGSSASATGRLRAQSDLLVRVLPPFRANPGRLL